MQTGKIVLDHADERVLGLHLLQFAEARQVLIEPICPLPALTCFAFILLIILQVLSVSIHL